jgi:photosystem II stability/assembly factor-like uncharacterized protein
MNKFSLFVTCCLSFVLSNELMSQLKMQPWEDQFIIKEYPNNKPSYEAIERGISEAKLKSNLGARTIGLWQSQGPGNIGARVNTIAIHPTNENIILAGFSDGGLWKTVDGGGNWKPIFENEIVQAIGHIAFDPNNPNTIYVGTGDPNISAYPRAGTGIYVSENMGETWKYIGLASSRIISKIIVDKENSNIIYAAALGTPFIKDTNRGVYKSNDKGKSWQKILFVNDSTGISDLVIDSKNNNKLYAIGWNRIRNNYRSLVGGPDAKIYKTSDAGSTWAIKDNGLPKGSYSRMGIALSESNPSVLYAQMTTANNFELEGIYRSINEGESWDKIGAPNQSGLPSAPLGGFGWYFGKLRINPNNADELFLLGVGLHRYTPATGWRNADGASVHPDKHDLVIKGNNVYLATDGGLYKSSLSSITSWQDIENIPTTQVYRTSYDPHNPGLYWLGAQDNGTCKGNSFGTNSWQRVWGGDGFQMQFDPKNPRIMMATSQNGALVISRNAGITFTSATDGLNNNRHWDMHYIFSQNEPNTLYTGTDLMYQGTVSSTDVSWQAISANLMTGNPNAYRKQITHVDQSKLDNGILYCGTTEGSVWGCTKKNDWTKITNGLPDRYVSCVKASPNIKNNAYVSFTGYRDNEEIAYIYKSTDQGKSWKSISSNLPKVAINDILVLEKYNDKVILVATDAGVYLTINSGISWQRLGINMPIIPVFDIDHDVEINRIIAGTYARSILTYDLSQVNLLDITSTKEEFINSIRVYPTLTQDILNLDIKEPYTIYDELGKTILIGKDQKIDVSSFKAGIYFINSIEGSAKFIVAK